MSGSCPKGYYWDGSKCRKSIVIKRHGIYGKGFESESQQQQEAKIRQVERIETPTLVDEQMAALNAFTAHSSPEVHRKIQNDLKYAEKFKKGDKMMEKKDLSGMVYEDMDAEERCYDDPNKIWVDGYVKNDGTYVRGYCRDRKEGERPNPEYKRYGVSPFIMYGGRKSRYLKTEVEDQYGRFNDRYLSKDGYHLTHEGKKHHVYKED